MTILVPVQKLGHRTAVIFVTYNLALKGIHELSTEVKNTILITI